MIWIDTKALFMTQGSEQADRLGLLEDKSPEEIGEWTPFSFRFDEVIGFNQYNDYTTVRFMDGSTQIVEISYEQMIDLRNSYFEAFSNEQD